MASSSPPASLVDLEAGGSRLNVFAEKRYKRISTGGRQGQEQGRGVISLFAASYNNFNIQFLQQEEHIPHNSPIFPAKGGEGGGEGNSRVYYFLYLPRFKGCR